MEAATEDHDSATYSIETEPSKTYSAAALSVDDVILPTVRRSAIQIVTHQLSPRRQVKKPVVNDTGTMQITKLVLRTPPGSPKRQSKNPGVLIKSIQTLAGPGLIGGIDQHAHGIVKQKPNVLTENQNVAEEAQPYRIVPIDETKGTTSRKDFEARRAERERSTNEFHDFLRESFKENKTPPSTPPPPAPSSKPAVEITKISGSLSSESEFIKYPMSAGKIPSNSSLIAGNPEKVKKDKQPAMASVEIPLSAAPIPAARPSLLLVTEKSTDAIQKPPQLPNETNFQPPEVLKESAKLASLDPSQESHITVEQMKPSQSVGSGIRPKQRSKTSLNLPVKATMTAANEPSKKKEKSYDPVRAREFIREQQAKRRMEKAPGVAGGGGQTKPATEKDLIKQRLETLRQSSQKLVSKNLNKARLRSQSCAPAEEGRSRMKQNPLEKGPTSAPSNELQRLRPSTKGKITTNLRKFVSTPTLKLIQKPAPDSCTKQTNQPKQTDKSALPSFGNSRQISAVGEKPQPATTATAKTPSGSGSGSSSRQASTSGTKIGILRKPDNLTLEDIAPFSPLKDSPLPQQPSSMKANRLPGQVNAQLIVINAENDQEKPTTEAEKELTLDVPDVTLVPSSTTSQPAIAVPEKSQEKLEPDKLVEESHPHAQPIKTIPSWLKQSLRQPDPYPFIVAVRKKLEAVRSVRGEEEGDGRAIVKDREKDIPVQPPVRTTKSHAYLDAIESVPIIAKPEPSKQAPRIAPTADRRSSDILPDGSVILTNISPYVSSNTTSEISSIRSDIPPPMPPLLCSTRVEVPPHQHLLSPTAPLAVSGPISPLSIDRISEMKIATPTISSIPRKPARVDWEKEAKEHTTGPLTMGPPISNLHATTVGVEADPPEPFNRSQKEQEYQRLLESFNRSLTHVIEVNQQLYSALKSVPAPSTAPPLAQEILRIRDEMTQTSLPVMILPRQPEAERASQLHTTSKTGETADSPAPVAAGKLAGGSTTTASNYSDDFEHQSPTTEAPRTPEQQPSQLNRPARSPESSSGSESGSGSSSTSSSTENSHSTSDGSSSSTSNTSTDRSSSSSESPSSNEEASVHNDQQQQQQQQQLQQRALTNRSSNSNKDAARQTRTRSNNTTAHSSDFDSRSFSLSDSHNTTTNNPNNPPMPDEYLPSFEESLRRRNQSAAVADQQALSRHASSSISERIDRPNEEEGSFSLKHSEEANERKLDASLGRSSSGTDDDSSIIDKDTLKGKGEGQNADTTINSDLLAAMFNRTDLEVSILSTTVSETNLSYSSIGMFDQLICSERSKAEQLVSRVHAKQKALLNRAKGQLAWLELQKQRYREKGATEQITAIKKKQRAILLRLEKDRAELNRTLKAAAESSASTTTVRTPLTAKNVDSKLNSYCSSPSPLADDRSGSLALRKSSSSILRSSAHGQQHQRVPRTPESASQRHRRIASSTVATTMTTSNSIQIAIRGRELEPNDRLEDILMRREAELRKRKEHVARLLEWHRKLEKQEEDLLAVEERLLAYNSRKLERSDFTERPPSIEERVRSIEKSLETLQSIPPPTTPMVRRRSITSPCPLEEGGELQPEQEEEEEEVVKMGGSKLNRLWYRLTGSREQRYKPGRNYHITRRDLEALYEDAKRCVLESFQRNDGQLEQMSLLERSIEGGRGSRAEETAAESIEGNVSLQTTVHKNDETMRTLVELEEVESSTKNETSTSQTTEEEPTEPISENQAEPSEEPDEMEGELVPAGENDGKYLLSSTVNGGGWSPENRRSIESVEFHTLEEETGTQHSTVAENERSIVEEPAVRSESYSMTFEEHSVVDADQAEKTMDDESQTMIADISLPPMLLNNTASSTLLNEEESLSSSSCESSVTVELSIPLLLERTEVAEEGAGGGREQDGMESETSESITISIAQSLEEASGSPTPTTITPTMASDEVPLDEQQDDKLGSSEEVPGEGIQSYPEAVESELEDGEDPFQQKSPPGSSSHGSELEKRLATLHDELEELSETFERTPLMKSPTMTLSVSPSPQSRPAEEERTATTTGTCGGEEGEDTFEDDGDSEVVSPSPSSAATAESSKGGKATDESGKTEGGESSSPVLVVANVTLDPPPSHKMEISVRPKEPPLAVASSSGGNHSRGDYPPPPHHQYHHHHHGHFSTENLGSLAGTSPPLSPPAVVRMPDIINEAEVLRRQQLQIEQEIKELEQQVGFFREIPNKPPPPYIPPANGSPLALLFPSETRIDELIDRRVEELHGEGIPVERLRSDHVTNVYEKLILDMCKELYRDLRPADPTVSFRTIPHDKRPLVFYNPPDTLRCMQNYLRDKVRRVLNEEQLALQQQHHHQQQQQHQQLLLHHHQLQQQQTAGGQHLSHAHHHHQLQQQQQHLLLQHQHCATIPFLFANGGCAGKRKRDQVDEILAQEMHDDDARWTNFDREEIEVKDRITDELLKSLLSEALRDMAEAHRCKNRQQEDKKLESAM